MHWITNNRLKCTAASSHAWRIEINGYSVAGCLLLYNSETPGVLLSVLFRVMLLKNNSASTFESCSLCLDSPDFELAGGIVSFDVENDEQLCGPCEGSSVPAEILGEAWRFLCCNFSTLLIVSIINEQWSSSFFERRLSLFWALSNDISTVSATICGNDSIFRYIAVFKSCSSV